MSPRIGGRDPFGRDHDHARELAATRLADPLPPSDAAWLASHLAWCAPCRAVAAEYDTQRIALRSLRLDPPLPPPRDLWARTAARLETEGGARPVTDRRSQGAVRGRQAFPVGPLAGLLVVAVVVGASLLNGNLLLVPQATGSPAAFSPSIPGPTPIAVAAREVPFVRQAPDGSLVIGVGRINEVCPLGTAVCGGETSVESREIGRVSAGTASDALLSPTRTHLVVLDRSAASGGVYVVAMLELPGPTTPPPARTPEPDVTSDPTASPGESSAPGSPDSSGSPGPSDPPVASDPPASAPAPSESAPVDPSPSATAAVTPGPGGALRIAENVVLVGLVAGYATDGSAFAFTARPADGSTGPDVFLWRPGEPTALPVTTTHDALFADWLGSSLVVSRAVAGPDGGAVAVVSSLLDPLTGDETALASPAMWRPVVDPLARAAVWWDGTVAPSADGSGWAPAAGRLVIGAWPGTVDTPEETDGEPVTDQVEPPAPTVPPSVAPAPVVLAGGPVHDWLVRWDETGTRLAVWIADADDPGVGHLTLYAIDPATGLLAQEEPLLRDVRARAGFSIGAGRIAWSEAAPGGGSRVEVLAWGPGVVGRMSISPADEVVVVR